MRRFLEGLLTAWSAEGEVHAEVAADGVVGRIERADAPTLFVWRRHLPFGIVWEVGRADSPPRAHPSAQGAIRSLGGHLAPERARGRVVFAPMSPTG